MVAQEVTLHHGDLTLNANLQLAPGKTLQQGVILITHGTLAHNTMELIASLQGSFASQGQNTLAINLSLGVDNRHGPYDCTVPHTHRHQDAITEIGAWVDWLKKQGVNSVVLLGHSRGGNQTAWFAAERLDPSVKAVILLSPMIWEPDTQAAAYQTRFHKPLAALLTQARGVEPTTLLSNVEFLYCASTTVQAGSVLSYYGDEPRFDTAHLLSRITVPTLVIAGELDTTIPDIPAKVANLTDHNARLVVIIGADHFFRDLYGDEVAEASVAFLTQLASGAAP